MAKHVKHLRSNAIVNNTPKQPSASSLELGEIAINYKKDQELLFIKNDEGEIVSFPTSGAVVALFNSIEDKDTTYTFAEGSVDGSFSVTPVTSAGTQPLQSIPVHGLSYLWGSNSVTTLTNLPIDKQSINATLSSGTNVSLSGALGVGKFLSIRCTCTAAFTQELPHTGAWYSRSGHSFKVESGDIFEMNIWCYESGKYSIVINDNWDGEHYAKDIIVEDENGYFTSSNVEGVLAELYERGGGSTSAAWGSITGTLANQTDLNNALAGKADDSAVVHLAEAETITGFKTFSNGLFVAGELSYDIEQNGSIYIVSASDFSSIQNEDETLQDALDAKANDNDVIHVSEDSEMSAVLNFTNGGLLMDDGANIDLSDRGDFSQITNGTNTLQEVLDAKATDSGLVHITGTETITGSKTFTQETTFSGGFVADTLAGKFLTILHNEDETIDNIDIENVSTADDYILELKDDLSYNPVILRGVKTPTGNTDAANKAYVDGHHDSTKQDTISDIDTIRSGAAAGATALQEETYKGTVTSVNGQTPDANGAVTISTGGSESWATGARSDLNRMDISTSHSVCLLTTDSTFSINSWSQSYSGISHHIVVKNTGDNGVAILFPESAGYVLMDVEVGSLGLGIDSGQFAEIDILKMPSGITGLDCVYLIKTMVQE